MKIISWNVNGIRAVLKKGFLDFVKKESPDILCVQEVRAKKEDVDMSIAGYELFLNSAEKKGYAGTAIYTKIKPVSVLYGMGIEEHDQEGRLITAEFDDFFLVTVYTPNAQHGLKRLPYKIGWDSSFLTFIKDLEKKKPVVFCGDLNVAHKEIDLANPDSNHKNPGFSDEEREDFTKILDAGFIDTFRHFNKESGQYTWWSYRFNAREKNIGWRIDYFCVSESILSRVKESIIMSEVMGSDHCPVAIEFI